MNKFINYLKSEVIMSISMFCAIISIFINPINKEYPSFIDMHTLILLFSLMSVIQIWNKYDVINKISSIILKKVNNEFKFSLSFTLICFFSSMLVTNDVSLITFVPIAIGILKKQKNYRLTISTIVMMTIAANLGSMFTPIGNPQNLYLDLKSQMSLISFFKLMTMLTLISLILIILSIYIFNFRYKKNDLKLSGSKNLNKFTNKRGVFLSVILFFLCILSVLNIINERILLLISLIVVIAIDIKLLKEVDYALLATFVFFFIFVGNINHLGKLNEFIVAKINNREVMLSIILSQFISNVPTAMLLSNYTNNYNALIIGTNLGGLGTFIASMASVISLKQFVKEFNNLKIKYILYFLSFNFCFLFIIYSCYRFIY